MLLLTFPAWEKYSQTFLKILIFRDFLTNYSTPRNIKRKPTFCFFGGFFDGGVDPSKKMRDVRTIHFHPFSRRELRYASENEGFRA